jgi:murein DD-endopeptidase MepM/ murein hydrolase activator NlpD
MRKVDVICLRGIVLVALAAGLSACSADMSRFAENPFNSRSSSPEATGSVKSAQSAPVSRVESKPLHGTQPPQTQPATASPRLSAAGHSQRQDVTGSIKSTPQYTWDGGTAVTAAQGETVESLALRYKVPEAALMQANGLSRNSVLKPGQRIVIPRRATAVPTIAAPVTKPAATAPKATAGVTHVVAPGETLLGVSRRYNKTPREIAAANQLKYDQPLKIGDRIVIPGVAASKATAPIASAPAPAPQNVASAQPQTSARMHAPAAEATEQTASANGAAPQFRWPVRGRVISGFGPMTNGQQNDGINLAVPEGTAVRAAEDGVVAYSGNELKGYGNLVLVRHNNGFVSAYAHASELMVKKGDTVRRGQVIARSGATGTVQAPQLHFEIRKGSVPVDPMQFLPGA